MDWLAHPIVVATYVALLSLAIAGVAKLYGLFNRMTRVEEGVQRLEDKVDELGADLRAHMADEGTSVARLEALIQNLYPKE